MSGICGPAMQMHSILPHANSKLNAPHIAMQYSMRNYFVIKLSFNYKGIYRILIVSFCQFRVMTLKRKPAHRMAINKQALHFLMNGNLGKKEMNRL